jgi:hypothetical protein
MNGKISVQLMKKVLTSPPLRQAPIRIRKSDEFDKKIIYQEEFVFGGGGDSVWDGMWAR